MRPLCVIIVAGMALSVVADEPRVQTHTDPLGTITHELPPELGDKPKQIARLVNPGITVEFRFKGETDVAVLVVTRIRDDYPKDNTLLDKQKWRSEAMQEHFGKKIVRLRTIDDGHRRLDEKIFMNCAYGDHYPYGLGGKDLGGEVKQLSIQQTFVADGRYVECAMHLQKHAEETPEQFISRSQKAWAKSVKTSDKKAEQVGGVD